MAERPSISLGLVKGAAAISFEDDYNRASERIRILITMTIWAIWKSRNKNSVNDQEVAAIETNETLKDLTPDLVRKSWNTSRFMEGRRRSARQRELRCLWEDNSFANLDLKTGPTVNFT